MREGRKKEGGRGEREKEVESGRVWVAGWLAETSTSSFPFTSLSSVTDAHCRRWKLQVK